MKTVVGEVKTGVENIVNQVDTKFKEIKEELEKINGKLNKQNTTIQQGKTEVKQSKNISTQTENGNIYKYTFDLQNSNEIKVDLKDEMSTSQAIVLKDNGIIQNTILWLKGDNRDFKGILITPKHIEKVIFYPNSFCKVINPSGKKLKYEFVDEYGNTYDKDFNNNEK